MCEESGGFFKRITASAGAYVSSPTLAKGTPSYLVSGAHALGLTMSDFVTTVTLIYTVVLLIGALPGIFKTWDFFRSRRKQKRDTENED